MTEEESLEYRVDHTAITVSNLDRSIQWYGLFGFREQKRFEREDLQVHGALLELPDGYRLELFQPYKPVPLEEFRRDLKRSLPHVGIQHFALRVNDVGAAYRELRKKGVDFAEDLTMGKTARYFFARDSDGIIVEVQQRI